MWKHDEINKEPVYWTNPWLCDITSERVDNGKDNRSAYITVKMYQLLRNPLLFCLFIWLFEIIIIKLKKEQTNNIWEDVMMIYIERLFMWTGERSVCSSVSGGREGAWSGSSHHQHERRSHRTWPSPGSFRGQDHWTPHTWTHVCKVFSVYVRLLACYQQHSFYKLKCYLKNRVYLALKLLSQPWWILIPKIKTNQNKQQYFTHNYYQ